MTAVTHPLLPLASTGCACCSPSPTEDQSKTPAASTPAGVSVAYAVEGMTCGYCVGRVQDALRDVNGVQSVEIDLQTEGTSAVMVTGTADPEAVRSAIHDAGYFVTES